MTEPIEIVKVRTPTMAEAPFRPKPVVRRIEPTHTPRRRGVPDDATRQRRRRVAIAIGVTVCVALLLLAPYLSGVLAERRVRALVDGLARTGGDRVVVRLARYERGYASADAVLEIVVSSAVVDTTRLEVPFRVGHGPIPWMDVFTGRSAFRVCAGFASFELGRGRSPTGAMLVPFRGRTVLGYLGGVEGELGLRADDIEPLSPNGHSAPARVTLRGDEHMMRVEGYLAEWRDPRTDGAALEFGGLVGRLVIRPGRVERHLELGRLTYRDAAEQYELEQLVSDFDELRSPAASDTTFALTCALVRARRASGDEVLRDASATYTSKRRGATTVARLAVAFASFSGPDARLGRMALRASTRVPDALLTRVVEANARVFTQPSAATGGTGDVGVRDRDAYGQAQILRLLSNDPGPEFRAFGDAVRALLRASPSLTIEGTVREADASPLFDGRITLRAAAARVPDDRPIHHTVLDALVVDIAADVSRSVIVELAELEVARRASGLATAEEPTRRASLALDVVSGAVESRAIREHDGVLQLTASIPLMQPAEATFAGRPLAASAETPLGLALRRAEMPRVRISLGAVVSSGRISDADVVIRIAPRARELRLCAEAELLDAQPVLEGDVQIAIVVGSDGRVSGTEVLANTLNDESFAACLTGVLARIPFNPTRGGGRSVVPIHVSRGGAPPTLDGLVPDVPIEAIPDVSSPVPVPEVPAPELDEPTLAP